MLDFLEADKHIAAINIPIFAPMKIPITIPIQNILASYKLLARLGYSRLVQHPIEIVLRDTLPVLAARSLR